MFRKQSEQLIPALMLNLVEGNVDTGDFEEPKTDLPTSPNRPANDRRARSIRTAKGLDGTEKPLDLSDAARSTYQILRIIFRASLPRHLEVVMSTIVTFLDSYAIPSGPKGDIWRSPDWCIWLSNRLMGWTQAQYRFSIISFWLEQLEIMSANSARLETILAILISLLSSQDTPVVNLAIGEVISCLSMLLIRNPASRTVRNAILAVSTHVYYPEQTQHLVGDLLARAMMLQKHSGHKEAIIALLDCTRKMAQSIKTGSSPIEAQWEASLVLLDNDDSAIRIAYLQALQTVLLRSSMSSSGMEMGPSPGLSSPSFELSRTARNLHMQIYATLQTRTLNRDEVDVLAAVLQTLYTCKDEQVVLLSVPVLSAFNAAAHGNSQRESVVWTLQERAFASLSMTWNISNAKSILALCSSVTLQEATSLSAADLMACLSRPFDQSPATKSFPSQIVRERGPLDDTVRLLPHPSSPHDASLAGLKRSLTHGANLTNTTQASGASSIIERSTIRSASLNESADGHSRQVSTYGEGVSPTKASAVRRLDRIVGGAEERQKPQR